MRLSMQFSFCLIAVFMLRADIGAQMQPGERETVRQFVQRFYDWYAPIALSRDDSENLALRLKAYVFTPQLADALRRDLAAQGAEDKAAPGGYVVGLDFDPFMNSQDPDSRYSVGQASLVRHTFWVRLHRVVKGKVLSASIVIAEVIKAGGKYRFSDFFYPDDGQHLLGILKSLAKDRKSRTHS